MEQDAPLLSGLSSFAKSFGDTVAKGSQNEKKLSDKEAFDVWQKAHAQKKTLAVDPNTGKVRPPTPKAGTGATSPADKFFYKSFSDARAAFKKILEQYKNPDMIKDMVLGAKIKAMSPEQVENQAELDYAKEDPIGHTLISDPGNQAHFQSLMPKGVNAMPSTAKPIVHTSAPGNGLTVPGMPPITAPGAQSMGPKPPVAPQGMPPIRTAQAPPPQMGMPPVGTNPVGPQAPMKMAQAQPQQQMKMPPVGNVPIGAPNQKSAGGYNEGELQDMGVLQQREPGFQQEEDNEDNAGNAVV